MPVEPIERYLAYLTDIERSPNTVKAYAHDLKDWFVFLDSRGLDWREVRLEDLGEFVAWLRLPPAGRDGRGGGVALGRAPLRRGDRQPEAGRDRRPTSTFHARHGVDLGELLVTWQLPQVAAGARVEAVPAPHQQGRAAARGARSG